MLFKYHIFIIKLFLSILILLFLSSEGLNSFNENKYPKIYNSDSDKINRFATKKDPFLSGFISAIMPGIGQIYSEEYTKGSLILLFDFLGKASIVSMIISFTNKYSINNNSIGWSDLNGGDKTLFLSIIIIYTAFYIWNVFDAIHSAKKYNSRNFNEPSINISFNQANKSMNFGLQHKF